MEFMDGRAADHCLRRVQQLVDARAEWAEVYNQLQELCTLLCVGGELFLRTLDATGNANTLLRVANAYTHNDVQVLVVRALKLLAEGCPRGPAAICAAGGVALLANKLKWHDFLVESEQLTEEVLACVSVLAADASRELIDAGMAGFLLSLSQRIADHRSRALCLSVVSGMMAALPIGTWSADLRHIFSQMFDMAETCIRFLRRSYGVGAAGGSGSVPASMTGRQRQQTLAAIRKDEEVLTKLCNAFVHIVDRVCVPTAPVAAAVADSESGRRLVPFALTLLEFSTQTPMAAASHAQDLRRSAMALLLALCSAAPAATFARMTQHGGWAVLATLCLSFISSSAQGNYMGMMTYGAVSHTQLDALSLTHRHHRHHHHAGDHRGGQHQDGAGLDGGAPTEPLVVEECHLSELLEAMLAFLPLQEDCPLIARRIVPVPLWCGEDEFRNPTYYDAGACVLLEIEYQKQRRSGRFVPIETVHGGRTVLANFEKMRHFSASGSTPLRPLRRDAAADFYHHCERADPEEVPVLTDGQATEQTIDQPPPPSSSFLGRLLGCCGSGEAVSVRDGSRRGQGRRLSAQKQPSQDEAVRAFLAAHPPAADALAVEGIKTALAVVRKAVSLVVIRHAAVLLVRALGLLQTPGAAMPVTRAFVTGNADHIAKVLRVLLSGFERDTPDRVLAIDPHRRRWDLSLQGDVLAGSACAVGVLCGAVPDVARELLKEGVFRLLTLGAKQLLTGAGGDPAKAELLGELQGVVARAVRCLDAQTAPRHSHSYSQSQARAVPVTGQEALGIVTARRPSPLVQSPVHAGPPTFLNAADISGATVIPSDCPVALVPVLTLCDRLRDGQQSLTDALERSCSALSTDECACEMCEVIAALEAADTAPIGTPHAALVPTSPKAARSGLLRDYLEGPDGAYCRAQLEDLLRHLVAHLCEQLVPAGAGADLTTVGALRGAFKQPVSVLMVAMRERAAKPVLIRLHARSLADMSADGAGGPHEAPTVALGPDRLAVMDPLRTCTGVALQAHLSSSLAGIISDFVTRYNEAVMLLARECVCGGSGACEACRVLAATSPVPLRTRSEEQAPSPASSPVAGVVDADAAAMAGPNSGNGRTAVVRRLDFTEGHDAPEAPVDAATDSSENALDHDAAADTPITGDAASLPGQVPRRRVAESPSSSTSTSSSSQSPLSDGEGDAEADSAAGAEAVTAIENHGDHSPPVDPLVAAPPPTRGTDPAPYLIVPEQVVLYANETPLLDPSRRLADVFVCFEPTAHPYQRFQDGTIPPAQLVRAIAGWALQRTFHFVLLQKPRPPLPITASGCTCGTTVPPAAAPRQELAFSRAICSPWHLYASQRERQGHSSIDDVLRLTERLADLLVPSRLLLDVGRKLYSAALHNARTQALSFVVPAFAEMCHAAAYRGAGFSAEYALWNYPAAFPFALRIAVFRQTIDAKRSVILRGGRASGVSPELQRPGAPVTHLMHHHSHHHHAATKLKVAVRREHLLEDARRLLTESAESPLPLDVEFRGEPGTGLGPTCEFFTAVAEALCTQRNLWCDAAFEAGHLFPRPALSEAELADIEMLGRLVGRALLDGREVRVPLHEAFAGRLVGRGGGAQGTPLSSLSAFALSDALNDIDERLEQSLAALARLSEEELEAACVPFALPGHPDVVLGGRGADECVTTANVAEFCAAVRTYMTRTALDEPSRRLLRGLAEIITPGHLRLFTPGEFAVLVGGPTGKLWPSADLLLKDIVCDHGYTMHSRVVGFLAAAVTSLSAAEQRLFLRFISGSDCMPVGGLAQPITIVRRGLDVDATPIRRRRRVSVAVTDATGAARDDVSVTNDSIANANDSMYSRADSIAEGSSDGFSVSGGGVGSSAVVVRFDQQEVTLSTQEQLDECLPTVNTCFHYLKLPDYSSEAVCRDRLLCAIQEGQGSFMLS